MPFVTLFRGDPVYQQLASAFSQFGAEFNVAAEQSCFDGLRIVRSGVGVGIVDPVVSASFAEGLVLRPFFPEIRYSIAILQPLHGQLSLLAQSFVEELKSALSTRRP